MVQLSQMMTSTHQPRRRRRRRASSFRVGTTTVIFLWQTIRSVVVIATTAGETTESSFLNLPLTYHQAKNSNIDDNSDEVLPFIVSHVTCAGESFSSDSTISARYRSCQFHNLCYHTDMNEYVLFPSPEELKLQELLQNLTNREFVTISSIALDTHTKPSTSTTINKRVSLGTIHDSIEPTSSSLWFPNVVADVYLQKKMLLEGYYQLPDDTVVFPIVLPSVAVSKNRMEVLIWLDFFAIHTVLSMFGLEQNKQPIFIIHNENNEIDESLLSSPLWSIFGNETSQHMGRSKHPTQMKVVHPDNHSTPNMNRPKSNVVCSKYSVAGLGMIATIRQGSNLLLTHAMGRGAIIYTFRNYTLSNLGIPPPAARTKDSTGRTSKIQITIAGVSDSEFNRLEQSIRMTRSPSNETSLVELDIRRVDWNDLSFLDSIVLTATSRIHITHRPAPHLLATATCLPRGATLIVLDTVSHSNEEDIRVDRIEQDYLEMAGYFHVHWLTMSQSGHIDNDMQSSIKNVVLKTLQSTHPQ